MDPLIVTQAINLLYAVSTLAVLALGLAVIFGLLGVLNIAHGEFIMIGAYCAYLIQSWNLPYLVAVTLTLAICGLLGWLVEWIIIRPLYRRPFDTLVATWGLSLVLQQAVRSIFGPTNQDVSSPDWMSGSIALGGLTLTVNRLWLMRIVKPAISAFSEPISSFTTVVPTTHTLALAWFS